MAQTGTPQVAYNNQANSIARNQAGGIAALGNSANPGAGLSSLVRAGNDATGNLNSQDALARNRNLLNLLQQRQVLAQQKDKAWDWNYQQKYLGNLAKSQALRTAGNSNTTSAFNDLSSGATTLAKLQYNPYGYGGQSYNGAGAPIGSGYIGDINGGSFNNQV